MNSKMLNATLLKTGFAACALLLAGSAALAQSTVTLTASPQSAALPDGQAVPMWGYTCGTAPSNATCTAMNGSAQAGGTTWQPPLITVPAGSPLTITLVNNLPAAVPTSLVIVGQLGGGLGTDPRTGATQRDSPSPAHPAQGTTWPGTLGAADPSACTSGDPLAPGAAGTFCPPQQLTRVRSFGSEVAGAGGTASVCWGASCTDPGPKADLRPGTYLIHSGTQPSIQHPMGLYGVLVVTEPDVSGVHVAYGTTFDTAVPLLFSEIDPAQNAAVNSAVGVSGFDGSNVWAGFAGTNNATVKCRLVGGGAAPDFACYPPAVNYSPRYYLINGLSFDATNAAASALPIPAAAGTQTRVMLRLVNAGLQMHVPAVVGADMSLIAEDGNKLPGLAKVQSSVFLAPGKTHDVTIQPKQTTVGTYDAAALALFDRALGVSTNNQLDGGMQAYLRVGTGTLPGTGTTLNAGSGKAYYCVAGTTLAISDPAKGLLAGTVGANGVVLPTPPVFTNDVSAATLALQSNGTFTYTPTPGPSCGGSFSYLVNGTASLVATITQCDASTPSCAGLGGAPTANADIYASNNIATRVQISAPGVLVNDTDPSGLPLTAALVGTPAGITLNADGSFTAVRVCTVCAASTVTFTYNAVNSKKQASASAATVTVNFPASSNVVVNVKDALNGIAINDYRWIIEEDKTFWVDPKCQINTSAARTDSNGRPCPALPVESLGYNFHTANMPVVAAGCMGAISCEFGQTINNGTATACDIGNGACSTDGVKSQKNAVNPSAVYLDPLKRYFISVLPGDGVNTTIGGSTGPVNIGGKDVPFDITRDCGPYNPSDPRWQAGNLDGAMCGHAMGGAQIAAAPGGTIPSARPAVNIALQQTPLPTAKIAVFVFQDDNPLNGENDAGGGVDVIAPNEPGLGGFEIKIFDQAGGLGDATGQITYDQFNMPVSNALADTIDPITGFNACPISKRGDGLVGMIPTCPKYEDGVDPATGQPILSPLAGQAVIANLYAGLYEIVATPAADRVARGEEWLQTNTLDGAKAHEAFIKPNEPGYFQEFGPGGFHVAIGFANPKVINDRKTPALCQSLGGCSANLNVQVTSARMSRTPDQRIYSSGDYAAYAFSQCYVSIGPADGEDFAFAKCGPDGIARFTNLPQGDFKLTVFDQWNDLMLDGLVSPIKIDGNTVTKEFPVTQWRANLYTRTFIDANGNGVSDDGEAGLALVNTNIRYRDGSIGFFNNTDLDGYAGFNEVFPFMNWLVVETSSTRFKQTGTHVVYDGGGPADGTPGGGTSVIADHVANTLERISLPSNQRVPGAVYCAGADCTGASVLTGAGNTAGTCTTTNGVETCTGLSTGRIDPPMPWGPTQAWQGLLGQNSYINFGMTPFAAGENGGIKGHVIYASTRPFDDPALSLQLSWEPGVPRVTINLYQKTVDASGMEHLTLVDTTNTTSWDDWAQGFRTNGVPNMNCPGQDPASPFFQTLKDSKQWLDAAKTALPNHSLFKCYDGWSQLNQIQPAPYDGMYKFPSVIAINPATGKPAGTNCKVCSSNPTGDGTQMLPAGKYVVEVIIPAGYELVKEEDKNILLGDVYVAPVTQQFGGPGNIFIMPDQAEINAYYNPNNPGGLQTTSINGAQPRHEGDTGSVESFWPCVGAERIVPDLNSLFPGAGQAAPFAGAKRKLCDRKEVVLEDQASVLAKFYVFSSAHIAGHFTGTITNDFASEFDPFSPQFGEKFGPPNLPVGMRDFTGNEVARVYSDQWGIYNGLYFSTYSVNPPNPTGYVPQMSIACMNDPGPIPKRDDNGNVVNDASGNPVMITDPAYSPAYSNYCYETPFMPGFTAYMDTPVIPTQAFADGYNLPDSEYPDTTPAIGSVTGSSGVAGPWVSATGQTLTITCLGTTIDGVPCSRVVQNPNYSGPNASIAPYNQKTIVRHYGFGGTPGTVTIAGATATCGTWSNTQLVCTVPTITSTLNTTTGVGSTCYNGTSTTIPAGQTPAQRGVSGAAQTNYRCGQLVVTAASGKRSIDAITVTVAGKAPTVVTPTMPSVYGSAGPANPFGRTQPNQLQTAIDAASPGDLLIVAPGTYRENLLMWKPLRLQGVGADSVTINADAHPAGKMDAWRRQVACLFGLTIDGAPNPGNAAFDKSGTYTCPNSMFLRSDRIPFEAFVGWDAAGNGNLAQILQEPTLMGAYEGAGITVLGRGIRIPAGSNDLWGQGTPGVPGAFPDGSAYLRISNADCAASTTSTTGRDYGTANYQCNPSRIDGVSIVNSSQGGGGVFMHGWGHMLEIANTRVYGNHGTLSGAINLGNGETPPMFANDGTICNAGITPAPLCPPFGNGGSLIGPLTVASNAAIPFQLNVKNHLHHNMIINNASIGDALFSGTPSGSGGITISAGSDAYTIDHNWIAGNLSSGDGAGMAHQGVTFNGTIKNNWILFNQSINPTLPTNGGGLLFAGANADRTLPNGLECGSVVDVDCPPGIGDGVGQGNVIDANLIMGNSAESGSGGGLRLQQVNGSEVGTFPVNFTQWYGVTVTNNIIANNVAGWDGGGVSMQDALKVVFVNNTVVSNDTTASAGVLFKTLGAINSSAPPPGCTPTPDPLFPQNTLCLIPNAPHGQQPAGLVTMANTPNLVQSMPGIVNCPPGSGYAGGTNLGPLGVLNGDCRALSKPAMANNMLWQNRAFRVDIVGPGSDLKSQQNIVALTPLLNQLATGQCPGGATYWDVGIRTDDFAAGTVPAGTTLAMANSILSNTGGVTGNNNFVPGSSPVIAQYCNGARVAPEGGKLAGFNVDPGRSETTGLSPVFVFNNITPAATVDEGHNWLNLTYGPLTLNRSAVQLGSNNPPELMVATGTTAVTGGAYSIAGTSAAVNRGANNCTDGGAALGCTLRGGLVLPTQTNNDFFGNTRAKSTGNPADVGAVEYAVVAGTLVAANPNPLRFTDVVAGSGTATRDLTLSNNGTLAFTIPAQTISAGFSRVTTGVPGNCGAALAAGASCTIRVSWNAVPSTATTTATAVVTGGTISAINVTSGGTGYATAPTVLLVGGGGIAAAAHAVLTGGAVTSIVVDIGGSGYTAAPVVVLSGGDQQPPLGTVTIAGVNGSPVPIMGNTVAALARASVGPSPLAFGNWATGTTSNAMPLTVTNVGNVGLGGGSFTFGGGAPQPFSRPAGTAGGTCAATLAVGASCTINVVFAPGSVAAFSRSLTVAYTTPGGATVEPTTVTLTGAGVANRAAVTIAPLTITLPTGAFTDDSAIVLTNNAPQGTGASMTVTNVAITSGGLGNGGSPLTYFFNLVGGQDACTGQSLPPGGTCSVGVRFTNVGAARGVNRSGTISFTSNGTPSPATGNLTGFATP